MKTLKWTFCITSAQHLILFCGEKQIFIDVFSDSIILVSPALSLVSFLLSKENHM